MKQLLLKITVVCLTLLLVNCSDSNETLEDQLPPITQTGENTFGCIVDKNLFLPKDSFTFTPGSSKRKGLEVLIGENFMNSDGDDQWFIRASNFKNTPGTYIYMYIPSLFNKLDQYIIQESDGSSGNERSDLSHPHIYSRINTKGEYRSFKNSGEIVFSKIDIKNGFYSGTFNVKLKNKDDENDIIEITDGRFDINLNTVNK